MNDMKLTWEELISATAEMEWPDQTPASLVTFSFRVDREKHLIYLLLYVDTALTDAAFDDMSEMEGGIISHLPEDWQTRLEIKLLPPGEAPQLMGGVAIYIRGSAQTPAQRWRDKRLD